MKGWVPRSGTHPFLLEGTMKTPTLDTLFLKPVPVVLDKDTENEMTVWIKSMNPIDRDMCQAYARRVSRELRKKLLDPDSNERQLLVMEELEEYNRDQLSVLWINNRLAERTTAIKRESLENRDQTFVPDPEGPDITNADLEQHELEVEEIEEQREESVRATVKSAKKELDEEVKEISLEDLRVEAEPALIENILAGIWMREFNCQMISRGTFLDEKCTKPAFKTSSEVNELRSVVLDLLASSHYGLMVEPEALKN